ncbi:hypothetical protein GCM10027258_93500 [Amycolatopsis stemonae]
MAKKKVPPCALVAGDAPDTPRPTAIVIALIFGFEVYLISSGIDVVTAVLLVVTGVAAASVANVKPRDVVAALRQLAGLVHILRGTVAP